MSPLRLSIEALLKGIPREQLEELGLPSKGELELTQLETGSWLLTLPSNQKTLNPSAELILTPLHQKVLRLLKTHKPQDLIEGRFENLLSNEELAAFTELVVRNKIIVYKSSPRFEKGLYREATLNSQINKSESKGATIRTVLVEKPVEEYSLVNDGFMVLRSDGAAKAASFDLAERIRAGEIKGIKSFDGFYYIIENDLLQKNLSPLLSVLKEQKKMELVALSTNAALPPVLARIVLEFAKEDGVVIEKQKNV